MHETINDKDASALALSYLLGQKNELSDELQQQLRFVGLSHIVVASGFHLAVVVGFAKKLFGKLSRFMCLAASIIFMLVYISITGFSPSMMRAGLVLIFSLWAWYYGRRFHPGRLIIYAMALSLLINPSNIIKLAWQLSFASYAGIIMLTPLIQKFFYGDKQPGFFASIIIASIAAQLLCLPLSLYYFSSFSLLAVFANLLVSPTISIVMLLALIVGITRFTPLAFFAEKILQFQLVVIRRMASFSWGGVEMAANNPRVFLIYVLIALLAVWLYRKTGHSFRPHYDLEKS